MLQIIKIKRGLETSRQNIIPLDGEIIYTVDNHEIYFGDGVQMGGQQIGYLNTRTGGTVTGDVTITGTLSAASITGGGANSDGTFVNTFLMMGA